MTEYPLKDLRAEVFKLGGILGKTHGDARPEAHRKATVAKIAYHAARVLDECAMEITEEDQEYICAVITSRMSKVEVRS